MKKLNIDRFLKILNNFKQQEIMVAGDLMLDRYIYGRVERISPEAPVPVINAREEKSVPGGAANVALNLVRMQAITSLAGFVGNDQAGADLIKQLLEHRINSDCIHHYSSKGTIQKVRVIGHNQQLLRIDYEDTNYVEAPSAALLYNSLNSRHYDALILSDYAKGSLTPDFITRIIAEYGRKNIPVIVDPKPWHKEYYKNCFLMKPNRKEAEEMTGIKITDNASLQNCGWQLTRDCACKVMISLGEEGMAVFDPGEEVHLIPTRAREVYDVSGAGDTVVAAITLALCAGASMIEAAELANIAAGIKVAKTGTHPVGLEEIIDYLENH